MDDRWLGRENIDRQKSVKGLIGMAGAYNIYPICVEEVRPVFDHPNYPDNSQPIAYVASSRVPTLLLVPEEDNLVSTKKNSLSLHQALLKNKTPSKVVAVKGTDHITVLGTLSPILFFKGDSLGPIQQFIQQLPTETSQDSSFKSLTGTSNAAAKTSAESTSSEAPNDLSKLPFVEGNIADVLKPIPICKP